VPPTASATPTNTPTPPPAVGGVGTGPDGGVVPTPPTGRYTAQQLLVLGITVERLERREIQQPRPPVQVPAPPVQVPSGGDGANLWETIVSLFGAQSVVAQQANPCEVGVSITNTVTPNQGLVGDTVNFSYTVTNDGTVPLTDVQVDSTLPSGLNFVSAGDGGSVDLDTGYVGWALTGGLDVGASMTLSVTATIAQPGSWDNTVCTVGHDALGNQDDDCATSTVASGAPTSTPTATVTEAPAAMVTVTGTATIAPEVAPNGTTPTPGGTATPGTPTPGTPTSTPASTSTAASTPARTSTPQATPTPQPTPQPTSTPVPAVPLPAPAP
jgi:uncharacterized repeat protein (TIGR01451 family)